MHPTCYLTLLLWLTFDSLVAQHQLFTIDGVLSAPYSSNLTGVGDRVVWLVTERGVRNIWTATFPDAKLRQLTQQRTDDGQDLNDLTLSPDGRWVAYVRGTGKNKEGVSPNPTSSPTSAEQAVYVVSTTGTAEPIRVGVGSHPVWSPEGKRLVYGNGGQLYLATISDKIHPAPTRLFTARGSQADYSFSPDGRRILFASYRGYHSLIGIYLLDNQQINWLAAGVDRDQFPVWSPDGRQVAFERVPGSRHGELENIQGGRPFAIWVADVATGQGREIWHSPGDDGGFAQYYPTAPLRWTRQNQLLFFSEHDGWMHVYKVAPTRANTPVDLMPGAFEVEETCLSADGRYLYYASNEADTDRRHLWRVNVETAHREQLTSGKGIDTDPVVVGQTLVYRDAAWNEPTGIAWRSMTNPKTTALFPAKWPNTFPKAALTEPQAITFAAADGLVVHGQLFLPPAGLPPAGLPPAGLLPTTTAPKQRPALLFFHGGPMRQMLLGWHYRGIYYANAYAMNQYLAQQGYVVLAVNYRAGIGYGRAFRRADKQGPRGASEYQDVLAAATFLQNHPAVDPKRLGLWGGSYGGYLTALGLARNSDLFACGVDLHGVHDWSWRGNMFSPGGDWGIGEAETKEALASSPNADLSRWRSPCLFIHGDDDRNVAFAETVDLVQKLRSQHVPTDVLILPDEVHGFLLHKSWLAVYGAMDRFLQYYLPVPRSLGTTPKK
ncbi:S9 family peptidase [Fibrella aquatilis]|uniref:Acyl-peptide hydrolase n=1 Tax=Fibrella aquatilis TaxID=2817059 RepID=A0A939G4L6_9BACT|nr:prolyl oligopeptidase family serine peptidase [Fibrella aquatilis]MBO0929901.1 S9 family peptidase [Fibrella aquatilis]